MKWIVKPLATIALLLTILGIGGTTLFGKVAHVSKILYSTDCILVVKEDGSLYGIGGNSYGQLGDGTTANRTEFVQILSSGVATAETGFDHSLILKKDGSLWGMGSNKYGQLGLTSSGPSDYNRTSPVLIVSEGVKQIAVGAYLSLFVKTDGSLWLTGTNEFTVEAEYGMNPVQIVSADVVSVSAGTYNHDNSFFFIKSDGSLWTLSSDWSPSQIVSSGVQSVATGGKHHLYLKTDGSLWGWGDNLFSQLGYSPSPLSPDHNKTSFDTPFEIYTKGGLDWISIWNGKISALSAGPSHTLLLDSNGTIFGMGNCENQLGRIDVFKSRIIQSQWGSSVFPFGLVGSVNSSVLALNDIPSASDPIPIISARRSNEFTIPPMDVSSFDTQFTIVRNVAKIRGGERNTFFIKDDGTLWFIGDFSVPTAPDTWTQLYYNDPVQVILPETTSDSGSSESNSSTTVDASKLNEAWGYFKYPWVYNSSIPSWLYLHATDQGQLLWCEKDQSWYSWDSTTQAWKKN